MLFFALVIIVSFALSIVLYVSLFDLHFLNTSTPIGIFKLFPCAYFNPITFTIEDMFSMSYMFQCIIERTNNVYYIFIVFRLCTKPTRSTGLLWNIDKIYKIYKPRRRNKYAIIFILYIDLTSVSLNLYCIFTVICYHTKPARSGCGYSEILTKFTNRGRSVVEINITLYMYCT